MRNFIGFVIIAIGVVFMAYLAGPFLLDGHIVMTFFMMVPGGLVLAVGIALLDDTPPGKSGQAQSNSSDHPPRD
ncbi:hypothetical protein [Halomonas sp.]|uniref:hypothetical protein n=1 Tax=Halomonas sp. TaxID=1486246 RepID=UPI00298E244E|nr:hypothetical protein [Halomonas sp.]MDW7745149.1 hypothetical protein [Halomonas sp.]